MHLGLVKSGDRLPSLRAAAAEFGVDQRSVLSAYRALVTEGLVEMRSRSGIYVADSKVQPVTRSAEQQWVADLFLAGFNHGVAPTALGRKLTAALSGQKRSAVCVECNTDSMLGISAQLRDDFGLATTWYDPTAQRDDGGGDRLRRADLVVTTHFHVAEARAIADEINRPLVVISSDRDYASQLRAALGRGPTYILGLDPRFAEKLYSAWDGARWLSNIRPMIVGRDEIGSLDLGSPVFVTRAAAETLGTDALPRGAVVLTHTLSTETRVAILDVLLS